MKSLKKLFLFLLGSFIVSFIFYFRVIYQRLPKKLFFFKLVAFDKIVYNYNIIFFVLFLGIFSVIILLLNYKKINNVPIKISFESFVKVILKLNLLIKNALFSVFEFVITLIPDAYYKMSKLALNFCYSKLSSFHYVLGLQYFIRTLILFFLYFDILMFFKLNFFYKSLLLLLIPLIIKLWLYSLRDWSNNKEKFEEKLDIKSENIGTPQEKHKIKFLPQYINKNLDLKFYVYSF